ncbi:MAG: hypothetical protein ACE5E6_10530 [Phycisphaerae bacterium]
MGKRLSVWGMAVCMCAVSWSAARAWDGKATGVDRGVGPTATLSATADGPGKVGAVVPAAVSRGDGGVAGACGACDSGGVCDLQVGINGAFVQTCEDGQWVSLAFPFPGMGGQVVDTIRMTHNTNTDVGDLYLTGGTCGGPDVTQMLASLGPAISGAPPGQPVDYVFSPVTIPAGATAWVVAVPDIGFAFDVAYNSATTGTAGAGYGNLDGGASPGLWQDLNNFGFGACYCVDVLNTGQAPNTPGCGGGGQCGDGVCSGGENCTNCEADCGPCPDICGPGAGDCCANNGTPGCDCESCCMTVCAADPFCCDTQWDGICADEASTMCGDLCAGGTCQGGPGGCDAGILEADPTDGTQDARQPFDPGDPNNDPAARQGIGSADEPIVLTLDTAGLNADCFSLCETTPDGVLGFNGIASVTEGPGGTYTIVLNHAIAPGGWTNVLVGGGSSVAYLALPADANADGLSNANDILSLIDVLNDVAVPPFGSFSTDIDHSGIANASDILRIIDLLNGAGTLDEWLNATAPDNDCGPSCGDGQCNGDETCDTCEADCGPCPTCDDATQDNNDTCECAVPITDGDTPFSNTGATNSSGLGGLQPGECDNGFVGDGDIGADIWYSYVATCDGLATFSTCDQATYDTKMGIYDGSGGCPTSNATLIACADDDEFGGPCAGFTTFIPDVPVTQGQTYFVRLGGFNGATGSGTLTISCEGGGGQCGDGQCGGGETCENCEADCGPCPPCSDGTPGDNDTCECALDIFDGDTDYSNTGATNSSGLGGLQPGECDNGFVGDGDIGSDIWYTYLASCTGALTVSTCDQASYDTKLGVYDGANGCPTNNSTLIGCADDDEFGGPCAGFTTFLPDVPVVMGQKYFIRVGGFNGAQGSGTLTLTCDAPAVCGDGTCGTGEDCVNCVADCPPPAACGAGAGDCCSGNGSPGCDQPECCCSVCAGDSFCCDVSWDGTCATEAAADPACVCP